MNRYVDRADAGRQLGAKLAEMHFDDPIVVGMARGGVPVAAEVARAIGAPLDVMVARKIGAPMQPELAVGAIAEDDASAVDTESLRVLGITAGALDRVIARERSELDRRLLAYRRGKPALNVSGRTAILVDDGVATGMTALAAARSLRKRGAARVVLAAPVCSPETKRELSPDPIDDVVCLVAPQRFVAVGHWYEDFGQVPDDQVVRLIAGAGGSSESPGDVVAFARGGSSSHTRQLRGDR